MNLRETYGLPVIDVSTDRNDPVNYLPHSSGGFAVGLLAGILVGLPFGFFGATAGILLGSLAGAYFDHERHAENVARERRRIAWQGRCDW